MFPRRQTCSTRVGPIRTRILPFQKRWWRSRTRGSRTMMSLKSRTFQKSFRGICLTSFHWCANPTTTAPRPWVSPPPGPAANGTATWQRGSATWDPCPTGPSAIWRIRARRAASASTGAALEAMWIATIPIPARTKAANRQKVASIRTIRPHVTTETTARKPMYARAVNALERTTSVSAFWTWIARTRKTGTCATVPWSARRTNARWTSRPWSCATRPRNSACMPRVIRTRAFARMRRRGTATLATTGTCAPWATPATAACAQDRKTRPVSMATSARRIRATRKWAASSRPWPGHATTATCAPTGTSA